MQRRAVAEGHGGALISPGLHGIATEQGVVDVRRLLGASGWLDGKAVVDVAHFGHAMRRAERRGSGHRGVGSEWSQENAQNKENSNRSPTCGHLISFRSRSRVVAKFTHRRRELSRVTCNV